LKSDSRHGTWYLAVDLPSVGGKRKTHRRGGHASKAEARRELDKLTARTAAGVKTDDRETVAVFLARWLEASERHLKPSTMRTYTDHVYRLIVPELGHLPL